MIGRSASDFITVKDVPADAFIKAYAEHLKKTQKVTPIVNSHFLKTGVGKELSPESEDWFYTRAAALARKIYITPEVGVGKLSNIMGKAMRHGHRPNKHSAASTKVIRYAIQELERADVLMAYNDKRNTHTQAELPKGKSLGFPRIISPAGQKELNEIAKQVFKGLYGQ